MKIGRTNRLSIVKAVDFGVYLDGGEAGEILMPRRYVPADCQLDDFVECFVYRDSEDRLVATTEKPFAEVGDFAYLEVVSVNNVGAFLNWGLMKDLFVPFREQRQRMSEGNRYIVYIYEDKKTGRIVGTAKIEPLLDCTPPDFEEGEEVDLLICQHSDLGYKAIINHTHTGVLYQNQLFQVIRIGQSMKGYIRQVREDDKIDLSLYKLGYEKVGDITDQILDKIKNSDGFLSVTDKSPSELIYELFGCSKKTYKKAIGELYRKRLVVLENDGVRAV